MPWKFSEGSLSEANYSSVKAQGKTLYKREKYKDAMVAFDAALALNPRSKTILLEKSKCFMQMGEVEKALRQVDAVFPQRGKNPDNANWRAGVNRSSRPPVNTGDVPETLSDLSYKCRYLLNKADAFYNKGDFENALLFYHKGHRLRPKAQEFKLGIIKSEDALKVMFSKKEKEKLPPRKTTVRFANPSELVKVHHAKEVEEKEEKDKKPDKKEENGDEGKEKDNQGERKESEEKSSKDKGEIQAGEETEEKKEEKNEKEVDEEEQKDSKTTKEEANKAKEADKKVEEPKPTDEHTPLPETYEERVNKQKSRKERIREARLAFGIKEREEARKIRAKYASRPNGHLRDDIQFLKMMYRTMDENKVKNKKVQRMTKDALHYLDSRNSFWEQQIPRHIREKSLVLPKRNQHGAPPPTQAMYNYMVKEMMRISAMMNKSQWHRTIENARKLIEHISKLERKIPNKENVMANCFSMIGNAYLEQGQDKKALAFHMKDLELSTKFDMDEAKLRALDNVGRVYARIGQFDKAIAIWEEKLATPFTQSPGERAWLYHEMGYCCIEIDDVDKAKECGQKSLEAAREKEDKQWQLKAEILISQALLRQGEAFEAKDEFEKALKLAKELEDKEAINKVEEALKELDEVLAEWDYLEDSDDEENNADNRTPTPVQSQAPASARSRQNQADWLLVEEEHKRLEEDGEYLNDIDNFDDETATVRTEKSKTSDNADKTIPVSDDTPAKTENNTESHSSNKKPPKKPETMKPKQSGRQPTKASSPTRSPARKQPNAHSFQKPKRELSNASLTAKPSRQNSNASMKGRKSRENSFSRPPRRELSNQSLRGKLSREGSTVSKSPSKSQTENKTEQPKPKLSRGEETAAVYLGMKSMSREPSNVSQKSSRKQAKSSDDALTRKPSREEQRLNTQAIDLVAATNDPEKSTLGNDDPTKSTKKEGDDPPAFITEPSTLTNTTT